MAGILVQVPLWSSSAVFSVWLHISMMVAASPSFQLAFQSEEWERVKSKGQRVKDQLSVVSIWKTPSEHLPVTPVCISLGSYVAVPGDMGGSWLAIKRERNEYQVVNYLPATMIVVNHMIFVKKEALRSLSFTITSSRGVWAWKIDLTPF